MFVNRTLDYRRHAKRGDAIFRPLSTGAIVRILGAIAEDISTLNLKQNKQCLPSFSSRRRRQVEIDEHKKEIASKCAMAEKEISKVLEYPAPQALLGAVYNHYMGKLKILIKDHRMHQQNYLERISSGEKAEQPEEEQCEEQHGSLLFVDNVREIRKSILELTSVLMDMKVAVAQQTQQIDRIDFYFETINQNLEGANTELEKMPRTYRGCKDGILYFLMLLCIVLAALSLLKMLKTG
jgi:hypothetical protein